MLQVSSEAVAPDPSRGPPPASLALARTLACRYSAEGRTAAPGSPAPEGRINVRIFAAAMAACLVVCLSAGQDARAQSDFKVTLLGTASPQPRPDRLRPSTLVHAGGPESVMHA